MANELELTGYVNNVKTFENGISTFGLAVGSKTGTDSDGTPTYKNGFVNIVTKQEVTDRDRITLKGFITFDFWDDKNTGKEKQAVKIFANEISVNS